jgi:hypothetical protein
MLNGWDVKKNTSGISLDPNACSGYGQGKIQREYKC